MRTHQIFVPMIAGMFLLMAACTDIPSEQHSNSPSAKPVHGKWGVETNQINAAIRPGNDFYRYVNDGWIETTTFPTGFTYFNAPWAVQLKINDEIDALIEHALASNVYTSEREERVIGFYQSYLSRSTINARGVRPIQEDLDMILSLDSHVDVAHFMGNVRAASLFNLLVQPPVDMEGGTFCPLPSTELPA